MIQKISPETYSVLNRCLARDSARSYFIRLGLLDRDMFQTVYADISESNELSAILCQRRSGTLQLWSDGNADLTALSAVMEELPGKLLISPLGCCEGLISAGLFKTCKPGAWIASLKALSGALHYEDVEPLGPEDIEEVDALYSTVFEHHMSVEQMRDKLSSGRGKAVAIRRQGRIAGVAQTEFEEAHSALIVGVATDLRYQRQGLAEACTAQLCKLLLEEGKTPWLQYDNPAAGMLYQKLGFEKIDRVMHCSR